MPQLVSTTYLDTPPCSASRLRNDSKDKMPFTQVLQTLSDLQGLLDQYTRSYMLDSKPQVSSSENQIYYYGYATSYVTAVSKLSSHLTLRTAY